MNFVRTHLVLQVMRIFLIPENSFHLLGLDTPRVSPILIDISLVCHEFADRRLWHYTCSLLSGEAFQGKVCSPFSRWLRATFAMQNQTKSRRNEQQPRSWY